MSSKSSNSSGPADASERRLPHPSAPEDLESQAVKTFAFEVTAARPAQPEDAELPMPVVPKPKFVNYLPAAETRGTASDLIDETPVEQPTVELLADKIPDQEDSEPHQKSVAVSVRPLRLASRRSSWWGASLGVHALLIVFLAFSTLAVTHDEEPLELQASPAVYVPVKEFEDMELDAVEELESLDEALAGEGVESETSTFAELPREPPLVESPLGDPLLNESVSGIDLDSLEIGQLFGDEGAGMTDLGLGSATVSTTASTTASFFGTQVKARRILYMLDNSGGMRKSGKFEALVHELQTSISVLKPKQKFYIVFYSDTVYPLFFPHSVRKFVPPTDKNRKLLKSWLDSAELCGGNAIDEALAAAEVIRPDVVFLLTDGDLFTTEKKRALLLNRSGRRYPIHTFGLGVNEQTKTADRLKQVAEANDGTFRAIKISEEMKALAKAKERPYHNTKPGRVWGLKVGRR